MGLFAGLKNVYGSYDVKTNRAYQVKSMVDKNVILGHLWGSRPYGVYLLVKDKTRAIAVDFDTDDLSPVIKFTSKAAEFGLPVYIERSKSKGHHIWIFFDHPIAASKPRLIVHYILNKIGLPATEVFPKRDRLDDKVSYGNFINAPMFCMSLKQNRTVFLDPDNCYIPYKDQWRFLYNIKKTSEDKLDQLIENLELTTAIRAPAKISKQHRDKYHHALPVCKQRMLDTGVTQYQRLACFRIAISLKQTGVSFDRAVSTLKAWAPRNRPGSDKRIITEREIISQTQSAYTGGYTSIGCECPSVMPFCDPNCPVRNKKTTL